MTTNKKDPINGIKSLKSENRKLKMDNANLKEDEEFLKKPVPNKSPHLLETLPQYTEETDDEILLFLQRSNKRVEILKVWSQGAKTPSIISKQTKDRVSQVSNYLQNLKEKELIACLNEKDKRNRFYAITPKGKKYLELVE